ncbi:MAG TPA: tetratricopeptide repeat protein [Desulfatiglandales bacterium]|nr:tetratricopeptide repeat protein [Desulfatiglandales bacterium]
MNFPILKSRLASPWAALIIIALTVAVIYSNIYRSPFVFDGLARIQGNTEISDLKNLFSLKYLLKPRSFVDFTFALNYRFGELNVFGYHLVNVLVHILNGVIIYLLASIIFKRLAYFPRSSIPQVPQSLHSSIGAMSLLSALIFIAHPVQTQAVTYTVQRYASMATMFYMGSVLFYLKARMLMQGSAAAPEENQRRQAGLKYKDVKQKGQNLSLEVIKGKGKDKGRGPKRRQQKHEGKARREKGSVKTGNAGISIPATMGTAVAYRTGRGFSYTVLVVYFLLSIICGILAFMSKQNVVSLPAAILLVEYIFVDRTCQGWKKKIIWFAPAFTAFVIIVFYIAGLSRGALQFGTLLEDVSRLTQETTLVGRWDYLYTQFNVLVIYIKLLFLPVGQSLDYLYPFKTGFFDGYTPLAFIFLTGLAAFGIWLRNRQPVFTFAVLWFFITLSAESSIIPIRDALFEHRLYIAVFGFALAVAYLLFSSLQEKQSWAFAISFFIIASLGTATYLRNRVYQDRVTLWSDVVAKNPQSSRAHNNLGFALKRQGNLGEAVSQFSEALRLKPDYAMAHYNIGSTLEMQNRLNEAISHFFSALRIRPQFPEAHNNLGIALELKGDLDDAVAHFSEALRLDPDYAEPHYNLAKLLSKKGDLDAAVEHYMRALSLKPGFAEVYFNLGNVLSKKGDLDAAVEHYLKALSLKPGFAEVHYNLGVALFRQGKADEAVIHYEAAVRLKPDYWNAHYELALALTSQGRYGEAVDHFFDAIKFNPDLETAHFYFNMGVAFMRQGKYEEAADHFSKALQIDLKYAKARDALKTVLEEMEKEGSYPGE